MTSKMHADQIEIDTAVVQRLIAEQFPQWEALPLMPVSSAGTDNALYRLGDDMVVRLPLIPKAADPIVKELTWLPILAPLLPVAIPIPLGEGKPTADYPWPWAVYRWLEGAVPTPKSLENSESLATELANFISALHKVDVPDGPATNRNNSLASRDADTRVAITALESVIDTKAATAAWEEALQAAPFSGAPVWVHGDLLPGNILVKDGHLSAVIDFGNVGMGDPALDLIIAWNLLPATARTTFRNAPDIDDATWQRGKGWALSIALIQLPYYKDTNPVMAAGARQTINEVLSMETRSG